MARFLAALALGAGGVLLIGRLLYASSLLVFIYYLIEFCMLMVIFHFCFQTSWEQALCCASAGRATQHLIYQILQLISLSFDPADYLASDSAAYFLGALLSYLPFCAVVYVALGRKIGAFDFDYEKGEFRWRMGLLSAVMVLVCVGITRFAKSSTSQDIYGTIAESLYAIICCLVCMLMQFELNRRAKLTKEMEMVRMLWKKDSKQLAERKDTIELINMKCHDIRHKLEDYHLPITDEEEKEIKSLIRIYDQTYRTGSQTLDVLLADRALLCEKDHIQLSFMGDGSCLRFLTESDIYSLLGNAVEAARGLEEEKRQISMIIRSSGDLVSISVTNYYQGQLHFEEDLPVTSQPDAEDFHGYGMKSMQAIAQKYGGKLKVKAEDGVFKLTIWLIDGSRQPA
ncbi:ATP-binding protein [Pseudoflavonifractor sp. CLA-AP-H29]|uniref:ATP-binding protein n=1 Tax=Pseudoflavonifractor intestinihominis TaxID=3133171 RepID=A0ABV1E734_9FIRM